MATTATTGVYKGDYVLEPVPPPPAVATLNGLTLSWTNAGGSTVAFRASVSQPQGSEPATCSGGSELYSGSGVSFTISDFSGFEYGLNRISLCAVNSAGVHSEPVVFEYETEPFRVLSHTLDRQAQSLTLAWNSLPGKSYRIQKSTGLGEWTDLEITGTPNPGTAPITAAAGQWTLSATASDPALNDPGQPKAFYRVRTQP